jgi:hypothetical protein
VSPDLCEVSHSASPHNEAPTQERPRGPHPSRGNLAQNKLSTQCNSAAASAPDCAARFYADTVQATADEGLISTSNIIAGTFSSGASSLSGYSSSCTGGGFESQYMCYLTKGDSAGSIPTGAALSAYNQYAKSWSVHDYDDVDNSPNCIPGGTINLCSVTDLEQYYELLSDWSEPTSDIWVTEAGNKTAWKDTQAQQASEAQDWENLKNSIGTNIPAHLFWYQYDTTNTPSVNGGPGTENGDSFDSALVDGLTAQSSGLGRQSYCVLALGYANRATCTG